MAVFKVADSVIQDAAPFCPPVAALSNTLTRLRLETRG